MEDNGGGGSGGDSGGGGTGGGNVPVPDVVGLKQSNAIEMITSAGLTLGKVEQECNNTISAGKVIRQKPEGRTQASAGSAVDIVISTGPCK